MMPSYSSSTPVFLVFSFKDVKNSRGGACLRGKLLDFGLDAENLRWLWIMYEEKFNMTLEIHALNLCLDAGIDLGLFP